MNMTGVALLLALFISNALALDFLYNNKAKFSGVFNIASLCLTVALAYHFKQMKSIATVLGIFLAIVVVIVIIRLVVRKKLNEKKKRKENEKNANEEVEGEEVKDENH